MDGPNVSIGWLNRLVCSVGGILGSLGWLYSLVPWLVSVFDSIDVCMYLVQLVGSCG